MKPLRGRITQRTARNFFPLHKHPSVSPSKVNEWLFDLGFVNERVVASRGKLRQTIGPTAKGKLELLRNLGTPKHWEELSAPQRKKWQRIVLLHLSSISKKTVRTRKALLREDKRTFELHF